MFSGFAGVWLLSVLGVHVVKCPHECEVRGLFPMCMVNVRPE